MGTPVEERVKELHDRAVRGLVQAHRQQTEEPLLLAIRYKRDDPMNIYLLEVLRDFPGSDDDELLDTEFASSANLLILGKLHLVLGSPGQLRAALRRHDPIIDEVKRGTVEYSEPNSEVGALLGELGLS
jgi:hypothetical protein